MNNQIRHESKKIKIFLGKNKNKSNQNSKIKIQNNKIVIYTGSYDCDLHLLLVLRPVMA